MKVLLLAAGVGRRLGDPTRQLPKALLPFGEKSLLQRHFEILQSFAVTDISVTVGHLANAIREECYEFTPFDAGLDREDGLDGG